VHPSAELSWIVTAARTVPAGGPRATVVPAMHLRAAVEAATAAHVPAATVTVSEGGGS
jgi:hypothetical protein